MDAELKKALVEEAEQSFFEDNFDYGDDNTTIRQNYFKAVELFHDKYANAAAIAERVSDGEILDNASVDLAIQEMIFSYRFLTQFRKDISGEKCFNPSGFILPNDTISMAIKGNELLGSYATSKNFNEYEQGKWCLYNTIHQ